jgi:membrane protein YdbS with pleckstrin-like domain
MAQYQEMLNVSIPGSGDLGQVLILLVVPVGIFLLGAGIGSSLRRPGVWTGPVLTLILSACAAYVLAGSVSLTLPYLLLFMQWIAFLVQPFSIIASVLVLSGTELFRRSIGYTITGHGIMIRGGIFRHVEQTIPHSRIGGVMFEQDLFGSRFNYGTLIPWRATSRDESGVHGQLDTTEPGAVSIDRTGAPRDPLTCLFGIPDPKTAQHILEKMMERAACRDD